MFLAKKKVKLSLTPKEALQNIYGMGKFRVSFLLRKLNYLYYFNLKKFSRSKRIGLSRTVSKFSTDLTLKKAEAQFLIPHLQCGTYKGIRFRQGLPANGQRTHSNASTTRLKKTLIKARLKSLK